MMNSEAFDVRAVLPHVMCYGHIAFKNSLLEVYVSQYNQMCLMQAHNGRTKITCLKHILA